MAIKSFLSLCLISTLIPFSSIASPSGKYRQVVCEISQMGQKICQVKSEYLGRMEYLQMTIRWPDGTVTKLKKPTGDSSLPWTDYFGREWVERANKEIGTDPRTRSFVNMRTRQAFRLTILD